jgi:hypothetical protein
VKEFGRGLIGIAILLLIASLFIDPSVRVSSGYGSDFSGPDRVVNLQRLQVQMMVFHGGIGSFIAGSVLLAVGTLMGRMEVAGILKPAAAPEAPVAQTAISCGWCDQKVQHGRTPCSAVGDERLRIVGPEMTSAICRAELAQRGLLRELSE